MVDKLNVSTRTTPVPASPPKAPGTPDKRGEFAQLLARETQHQESLRISSHAQKRLNSSQITLTDSDIQRIGGAVQRATEKGSNQSLVMLDNLALVVSIKNGVVITAVDEERMKEGVFTNIDSVVIA